MSTSEVNSFHKEYDEWEGENSELPIEMLPEQLMVTFFSSIQTSSLNHVVASWFHVVRLFIDNFE